MFVESSFVKFQDSFEILINGIGIEINSSNST